MQETQQGLGTLVPVESVPPSLQTSLCKHLSSCLLSTPPKDTDIGYLCKTCTQLRVAMALILAPALCDLQLQGPVLPGSIQSLGRGSPQGSDSLLAKSRAAKRMKWNGLRPLFTKYCGDTLQSTRRELGGHWAHSLCPAGDPVGRGESAGPVGYLSGDPQKEAASESLQPCSGSKTWDSSVKPWLLSWGRKDS